MAVSRRFMTIKIERTPNKRLPALWEEGHTLYCQLVAGRNFEPLERICDARENGKQAKFKATKGVKLLRCTRSYEKGEPVFHFLIYEQVSVRGSNGTYRLLYEGDGKNWDVPPPFEARAMINAALAKLNATGDETRKPFYEALSLRGYQINNGLSSVNCKDCSQPIEIDSAAYAKSRIILCLSCGSVFKVTFAVK